MMIDADDFKAFNDAAATSPATWPCGGWPRCSGRRCARWTWRRATGARSSRSCCRAPRSSPRSSSPRSSAQAVEKAGIGRDEARQGRPLTVSIGVASLPGDAATRRGARGPGGQRALHREEHGQELREALLGRAARAHPPRRDASPATSASSRRSATPSPRTNVSEGGVLFHSAEPLPSGAFVKVQLALPPSGEPIECAVRVLRVVGARGGFEIGTQILHMPRLHQRRFRQFLKQLKAGEIASRPPRDASSRAPKRAPAEPKPRVDETAEMPRHHAAPDPGRLSRRAALYFSPNSRARSFLIRSRSSAAFSNSSAFAASRICFSSDLISASRSSSER